jgi:hypothetical protein
VQVDLQTRDAHLQKNSLLGTCRCLHRVRGLAQESLLRTVGFRRPTCEVCNDPQGPQLPA